MKITLVFLIVLAVSFIQAQGFSFGIQNFTEAELPELPLDELRGGGRDGGERNVSTLTVGWIGGKILVLPVGQEVPEEARPRGRD